MSTSRGGYGSDPEDNFSESPDDIDDWGAEDWENFWSEPEEPLPLSLDDSTESLWEALDDDEPLPISEKPSSPLRDTPAAYAATDRAAFKPPALSAIEQARWFEKQFVAAPNAWDAAQASASFRRAGQFEAAIKFVIRAHTVLAGRASAGERAAMLTTAGAAYADLHRYQLAFTCAQRAIELAKDSSHPWLVAGRAAAKLGRHAKADELFAEGRRLKDLEKKLPQA